MIPSMEPQHFCSLPWCGRGFGGPYKTRIVGGKRLTYPGMIDAHHPFGRPGPVVYICHDCHIPPGGHTRGEYRYEDGAWEVRGESGWVRLRIADGCESA